MADASIAAVRNAMMVAADTIDALRKQLSDLQEYHQEVLETAAEACKERDELRELLRDVLDGAAACAQESEIPCCPWCDVVYDHHSDDCIHERARSVLRSLEAKP